MASTPFSDLKSQDILSAHISGIQHSVNKLENVLNLQTATVTGHSLVAVKDQPDATLHNFIYEGTVRNWLNSPSPIVKRNGVVVPQSEYKLQAAYGVIVFNVQQDVADVITADFTHVTGQSAIIEDLNTRLLAVESSAGDGGSGGTGEDTFFATVLDANEFVSNLRPDGRGQTGMDVDIGMAAGTIDAFPVFIQEETVITHMLMETGPSNTANADGILGIYTNDKNRPKTLVAQTDKFLCKPPGAYDIPLKTPTTLKRGFYWFAFHKDASLQQNGYVTNLGEFIMIKSPNQSSLLNSVGGDSMFANGVRTGNIGIISTLPTAFPAIGTGATDTKYLHRNSFGYIKARKQSIY